MKIFIKYCIILLISILFSLQFFVNDVLANDREHLRETLEQQENDLSNEMNEIEPLESLSEDVLNSALETANNNIKDTNGKIEFSPRKLLKKFQKGIFTIAIKTRTAAILIYSLFLVAIVLYISLWGSRYIEKRSKAILMLKNISLLFFIYINLPLIIIWLNTDKSYLKDITLFDVVYNIMEFFKSNSIVIGLLMIYAGVTRIIISKNNLPVRKQGDFLVKVGVLSFIFLNIAPLLISFLI